MSATLINCPQCKGTGVYVGGFAEPRGVGIICSGCNGTGATEIPDHQRFTGRKRREDVTHVRLVSHCRLERLPTDIPYDQWIGSKP